MKNSEQTPSSASAPRLVLRWVFVGWWAVPLLAIGVILTAVLDAGGYWDGKKWVTDPDLDAAFLWCCEQIGTFFQQNVDVDSRAERVDVPRLVRASDSIGLSGALHRVKSLWGFCWHNPIIGPVIWIAGNLIWWGGLIVLSGYIGAKLFEAMEHTSFVRGLTNLIEIRTNPGR